MPDQKTMRTSCLGVFFCYVGHKTFTYSQIWLRYQNFLLSPEKLVFFLSNTTKFGPKLALLFILGQALPAHLVPCCRLWRAGCISQDGAPKLFYENCCNSGTESRKIDPKVGN